MVSSLFFMSYFKSLEINEINPLLLDAFGRVPTSFPSTLLDLKQLHPGYSSMIEIATVSGSCPASAYDSNRASTKIKTSNTTAGRQVLTTNKRANYVPGKSLLTFQTFILGNTDAGTTKRVGLFDDNNGVYLKSVGNAISLVIRSNVTGSPVETTVSQSNWNIDKLNGAGGSANPSGFTLDLTKVQIFGSRIEWLGVGSVTCFFVIHGQIFPVHRFNHANSNTAVYMSTPVLPLRFEIQNSGTGGASELECICMSVIAEGGQDTTRSISYVAKSRLAQTLGNGHVAYTNWYPTISFKLKTGINYCEIIPLQVELLCSSNNAVFALGLFLNPTIGGVDGAVWTSTHPYSSLQFDVSRGTTNTLTFSEDKMIYSLSGSSSVSGLFSSIDTFLYLTRNLAGVSQEMVIAVAPTTNAEVFNTHINFKELL